MNKRDYRMEKQNRALMDECFNKFKNDEAGIKQKMFTLRKQAEQAFRKGDVHRQQ
jgi:hypothetical protein